MLVKRIKYCVTTLFVLLMVFTVGCRQHEAAEAIENQPILSSEREQDSGYMDRDGATYTLGNAAEVPEANTVIISNENSEISALESEIEKIIDNT